MGATQHKIRTDLLHIKQAEMRERWKKNKSSQIQAWCAATALDKRLSREAFIKYLTENFTFEEAKEILAEHDRVNAEVYGRNQQRWKAKKKR